jgi:anti-sigma-K factor RskA
MSDEANRTAEEQAAEREALIASYALGGMTGSEAAAARRLIETDTASADLYAEFAAIATTLPAVYADVSPADAVPSAALKTRIMSAARADLPPVGAVAPPESAKASPRTPVSITAARGRRAPWYAGWLVAAALLIAVIGLGAWNLNLHRDMQQANRDRDIVRLASDANHAYTMAGTQNAPTANATLIESGADGGRVVLLAKGFPQSAAGQTYRIWLQKQDGSYVDVGTFTGGDNQITLVLPGNLNGIHAVTITAEPAAKAAAQPTGVPVMEGTIGA